MTELRDELDDLLRQALNDPVELPESGGLDDVRLRSLAYTRPRARSLPRLAPRVPRARGTKGRWAVRASLAAGVAVVAALTGLFYPGSNSSVLDRAAAALKGNGDVLHVVYSERWDPAPTIVNLSTGVEHPAPGPTFEVWYDEATSTYKQTVETAGVHHDAAWRNASEAVDPEYGTKPADSVPVPAFVRLFSHYGEALSNGGATLAGEGTVDGHSVYFVDVTEHGPAYAAGNDQPLLASVDDPKRIAIDRETYAPVAVYPNGDSNDPNGVQHIQVAELVRPSEADLTRPVVTGTGGPRNQSGYLYVTGSHEIARSEAQTWLGAAPVGVGDALAGLSFAVARADELPGEHGLQLVYGASCDGKPDSHGQYVLVQEAQAPAAVYAMDAYPPGTPSAAPVGTFAVALDACGAPSDGDTDPLWYVSVQLGGLAVSVASPVKALALQAAQELAAG